MLTLTGVILIPKVKEKLKLSKKKSVTISIVLGFFSIIAIAVEAPYSFVGKWESLDNSYTIELKEDNTFILKTNEGENISGTFSNTYENEEYTITLSSENYNIEYLYCLRRTGEIKGNMFFDTFVVFLPIDFDLKTIKLEKSEVKDVKLVNKLYLENVINDKIEDFAPRKMECTMFNEYLKSKE